MNMLKINFMPAVFIVTFQGSERAFLIVKINV